MMDDPRHARIRRLVSKGLTPRTVRRLESEGHAGTSPQCPACRQTWALYRGILAKYEAAARQLQLDASNLHKLARRLGIKA